MARYQTVGLSSTFATPQSNHFHHHHHRQSHQDQHPPAAYPIQSDDRLRSPRTPAFASSSRPISFSAVEVPPSGADFRHPELTSGVSGRRPSDCSSSCLRSEWVTLSKAMLMVLVEKICQLSFESEPVPPGTSSELQGSSSSETSSSKNDNSGMIRNRLDGSDEALQGPTAVPHPSPGRNNTSAGCSTSSVDDSEVPALIPSPPSTLLTSPATDAPCQSSSERTYCCDAIGVSGQTVKTDDATRQSVAAVEADARERCSRWSRRTGLGTNSGQRRNSNRNHEKSLIGGKVGKGEPRVGGERKRGLDESIRKLKVRSLRQRNSDRNAQPWVACNKSLVYSMIDSALGTSDDQQVSVTTESRANEGPESVGRQDDGVKETTGSGTIADGDAGGTGAANAPPTPVAHPKPACEAPLLGALLSYDDPESRRKDSPGHASLSCRGRPSASRSETLWNPRPSTTLSLAATSGWQGAHSSGDRPFPLPGQKPFRFYGQRSTVSSHQVPTTGVTASGFADVCTTRSSERSSRRSVETVGQTSPRSESASVDSKRRGCDLRPPGRRRVGSEGGGHPQDLGHRGSIDMMMMTAAHSETEVERPLWIALDKSEVCSLVDSLVSTMMSYDDVTSARCRSGPSSSGAVSIGNADECNDSSGDGVLDTAGTRIDSVIDRQPVASGDDANHGNDVAVDLSKTNTTGAYNHDEVELGDHGNGRKRCRRKQDTQCLLAEGKEHSEDGSSSRTVESEHAKETGSACSQRRDSRGSSDGSKFNLKWKSNMMLRLHSQSQDGENE